MFLKALFLYINVIRPDKFYATKFTEKRKAPVPIIISCPNKSPKTDKGGVSHCHHNTDKCTGHQSEAIDPAIPDAKARDYPARAT